MKLELFFIVITASLFCFVCGDDVVKKEPDSKDDISKLKSETDEDEYYQPCHRKDLTCIRQFFAHYGDCLPQNTNHKPIYRERQIIYLPAFNLTIVYDKHTISGLEDGVIEEFYINKKTGNLVMSVDFKAIIIDAAQAYFQFQLKGKEPVITSDYINATLTVTLTAVIPISTGVSLKEARVTPYLPKNIPEFYLGPKIQESKESVVAKTYAALMKGLPIALAESFLTEAPSFFLAYLQNNICDFHVPIGA